MSENEALEATPQLKMLSDPGIPLPVRKHALLELASNENEVGDRVLKHILDQAAARKAKQKFLELIEQMQNGPLRVATFVSVLDTPGKIPRAHVLLEDGSSAYTVLHDPAMGERLERGDTVLLEAQARTLLFHQPAGVRLGEEAELTEWLDDQRVEVVLRDHERVVYRTSEVLATQQRDGDLHVGDRVIVCSQRRMAFESVPQGEAEQRRKFLSRQSVPDIVIDRDVGAPPRWLKRFDRHLRRELENPGIARRYGLRRCFLQLLSGVSGSGKSYSVQAAWNHMYAVLSEHTGVPVAELPQRVMHFRPAQVLSQWLGQSEKQIAEFFDELEALADEPYVTPDGREVFLPVYAICEEVDGVARARGEDSVYDRIQTTLLDRLDTTSARFRDQLVFLIFTTNVANLVDSAFLRRAGAAEERFGRLARRAFESILWKHLQSRPLDPAIDPDPDTALQHVVQEMSAWLFSKNGSDPGQVSLTYAGSTSSVLKYRRDFLTGGLVDRAVQQAADVACDREENGEGEGLTTDVLMRAFADQVDHIVARLEPQNCHHYLDLPDDTRVAHVRGVPGTAVLPTELLRAS